MGMAELLRNMYHFILIPVTKYFKIMAGKFSLTTYVEVIMNSFIKNMFYKQRQEFQDAIPARDTEFTFPADVTEIRNVPYAEDSDPAHRMDIYRADAFAGRELPVILNIHGGGLILGCKEYNRYFCAQLSKLGYLVFSIEYRLVPDCLFFDQCEDVFTAMRCIKRKLPEYRGLKDRVYAVGDSGGAMLLTYCTAMQNSPKLAGTAGVRPASLRLKALGLISGMYYTTRFDKIGLFLPSYLYGHHYKRSAFSPYVNPEHPGIVTALPPCFLTTSAGDYLRTYTLDFEKALSRCQVSHHLLDFSERKDLPHAFSVIDPFRRESIELLEDMSGYFQQFQ